MNLTLTSYIAKVASGDLDPKTVADHYLQKSINEDVYNAYVRTHPDYVSTMVETFSDRALAGAPIAVKDIFLTQWYITSCASQMLEDYVSPYSSTVFERLESAGWLMLGKANMDEFAMWGSNETSYHGPVKNPHDLTKVAGWSSGWSAATVAGDLCLWALGTDTGGSVRLPAALCGIVGIKPTYGRASRYGVQAMSSSLDQPGTLTKTVDDGILLLDAICWADTQDATNQDRTWQYGDQSARKTLLEADADISQLKGKKFALPKQFLDEGLDDRIRAIFLNIVSVLRDAGVVVDEVDLPLLQYGIMTYYIICPAEVSTNMARFDWVRYGLQDDTSKYENIQKYYEHIRGKGFGDEVQRRIMIGSYVLSAGYYDAYYNKAVKIRAKMKAEIDSLYETYDAIIGPTAPMLARDIWSMTDPVQNYLVDTYTVIANLCGYPAMSVPMWSVQQDGSQLPTGLQIMTRQWDEYGMLEIGRIVESVVIG